MNTFIKFLAVFTALIMITSCLSGCEDKRNTDPTIDAPDAGPSTGGDFIKPPVYTVAIDHEALPISLKAQIGKAELALMKPHAIIVNMGRGGIVDEAALAEAVDNGIIAGAGMDVYTEEPMNVKNPLSLAKHQERLSLTPHTAWASVEARKRLVDMIAGNIAAFLSEGNRS